jgi:N-acetylneuraminate synthase
MSPCLEIAGRRVGPGCPVYIIAELSANHGQSLDQAVALVRAAAAAGADAVKLQTYTADTLTIRSDRPEFRIGGGTLWDGRTLYDLYAEAYTPWEWHPRLQAEATALGLHFFSTAFDPSAVDFLEGLGVPVHKVASFEIVDLPLIRKMARTGKPLILSTGMASREEIAEAVAAAGAAAVALLKCTSAYPAPPEEMNLPAIPRLAAEFAVPVGLSDHTLGTAVPVAAVALGACIVEKHLTLSRAVPGPDSAFSLEPHEFRELVTAIRTAEKALQATSHAGGQEARSRVFRRSLYVVRDVRAGEPFTADNVRSIRPACGLPPRYLDTIRGQAASRDIRAGTPLDWSLVALIHGPDDAVCFSDASQKRSAGGRLCEASLKQTASPGTGMRRGA